MCPACTRARLPCNSQAGFRCKCTAPTAHLLYSRSSRGSCAAQRGRFSAWWSRVVNKHSCQIPNALVDVEVGCSCSSCRSCSAGLQALCLKQTKQARQDRIGAPVPRVWCHATARCPDCSVAARLTPCRARVPVSKQPEATRSAEHNLTPVQCRVPHAFLHADGLPCASRGEAGPQRPGAHAASLQHPYAFYACICSRHTSIRTDRRRTA